MKLIPLLTIALACTVASCNNTSTTTASDTAQATAPAQEEATTQQAEPSDADLDATALARQLQQPVVTDFYATWCGPCKKLTPILERLEKKYRGSIHFQRVDVDKHERLANDQQISVVPTLIITMPNGKTERIEGLLSEAELDAKLASLY